MFMTPLGADDDHVGRRRAAIALVALGEDRAAQVLNTLNEREAFELASEVLSLGPVTAEEITAVLLELTDQLDSVHAASAPGEQYTRSMLAKAFGSPTAARILEELTRPPMFAWLADADPDVASRVLAEEPPSTIALALAHLDAKSGAKLLTRLPEHLRADVALRVATLDAVDTDTISTVDAALRERVGTTLRAQVQRVHGTSVLAGMLSATPRSAEEVLIDHLQVRNPDLAHKVRSAMFRFDDLPQLSNRDLQKILSQIEVGDLAIALSSAKPDTTETLMNNLSERARANLEEEISFLQNLRASDVRHAQEKIMETVRQLETDKEIVIPRAGDEDEDSF